MQSHHIKTLSILFTIALVLSINSVAAPLHAATVAWNTPANITGDTNVLTTGSLVVAYNIGDDDVSSATVNGVTFAAFPITDGDEGDQHGDYFVGASPNNSSTATNYGSAGAPFTGLSASYQTLLGTGAGTTGDLFISMAGLTPGDTYTVEIWGNDSGLAFGGAAFNVDNIVSLDPNTTNAAGGIGQFAVGVFTADDATQTIDLGHNDVPTDVQTPILNAFQVRLTAVPEPSTLILGSLGLLGLLATARRKH